MGKITNISKLKTYFKINHGPSKKTQRKLENILKLTILKYYMLNLHALLNMQ
jgi:hypothetical protein